MADLSPFVFQGQLPRQRLGRAAAGAAGQLPPVVPGASDATAQAGSALGTALSRVSVLVNQIDERFRRTQALNQGTAASVELLDAMQQEALRLEGDPDVDPIDRAAAFAALFDKTIEDRAATLPREAKARFLSSTATARRQTIRALTQTGREETRARGVSGFNAAAEQAQVGIANATSGVEEQEILLQLSTLGANYVGSGVFAPEEMNAKLQDVEQDAVESRMRIRAQLDPARALDELQDAANINTRRLGPGVRAMLLDKAQQEVDSHTQREESASRRSFFEMSQAQESVASRHFARLTENGLSLGELQEIQRAVNADGETRRIGLPQQTQLSGWITAQERALANEAAALGLAPRDRMAQGLALALETARNPAQVAAVEANILSLADQLGPEVAPLLKRVNVRRDATHMTNQDAYHEGLDILKGAAGVVDEVSLISLTSDVQTNPGLAKLARTIEIYRQVMEPIYDSPGGFLEGNQRAVPEARQLAELYFPFDPLAAVPEAGKVYLTFANKAEYHAQRRSLGAAQLSLEVKRGIMRAMRTKWGDIQRNGPPLLGPP